MEREGGWLVALMICVVALTAVLPISRLLWIALGDGDVVAGLDRLAAVARERATLRALETTILVAMLAGAGSLLVGGFVTLVLAITDVAGKRVIAILFVLSLMVAPQVSALAFKTLAGPASPLLGAVGLAPPPGTENPMLSFGGIVFVMALHHAPLAAITIAPGVMSIPRAAIDAAQIDGANPLAILTRIVLPLLGPHIFAAGLLVLVAGIGNFGIPALLGLPVNITTLPTLIYQRLAGFGPSVISQAAQLSVIVAGIAGLGVVAASLALRRAALPLETEEALVPFWKLGWVRLPVAAILWVLIAAALLLPLASLLASALVPAFGVRLGWETITLDRFAEVLLRQGVTRRALVNSLALSATAAVMLSALAVVVAYVLERRGRRWRALAEPLIEMPYALPGIVVAITCILLFLRPLPLIGVSIYATPAIILAAYLMRFLPLALKPPLAAMAQLSRSQEEAATVDGARLGQRLWHIVVPSLASAAAAGALLVFLLAFNELTLSALLWSAGTETIGVALLSLDDAGLGAEAAAVGVTSTGVVTVIIVVLDRMRHRLQPGVLPWSAIAGGAR
jgi:iron(III) transport system permease protein